ncbi:hypothetical protein [Roseospira navarrensis]|uniref:Transmembrane protein n=1 Tax=Roseospira navarrensis TaxID=140058 RepID=A0A7X2D3E7_9PROT|nr:hypothetical protein [Roseospira navarrensis]MQX35512.1 hypothetical protein [Roseospira navarrensis]
MLKALHPVAGGLALVMIATFWGSTVAVELLGPPAAVVAVKTAIPWAFLLLVPALAFTGLSGTRLARGRSDGLAAAKRRRMPFIAANGLFVLMPAAFALSAKADAGAFDAKFNAVQAVELVAGAVNIVLLGRSLRDGLRLTGRLPRVAA